MNPKKSKNDKQKAKSEINTSKSKSNSDRFNSKNASDPQKTYNTRANPRLSFLKAKPDNHNNPKIKLISPTTVGSVQKPAKIANIVPEKSSSKLSVNSVPKKTSISASVAKSSVLTPNKNARATDKVTNDSKKKYSQNILANRGKSGTPTVVDASPQAASSTPKTPSNSASSNLLALATKRVSQVSLPEPPTITSIRVTGTSTSNASPVPMVSTPAQYDSSKDIALLKQLNTDLLYKIKNLEDELNSTKMKFEELSNSIRWDKTVNEDSVTLTSEPELAANPHPAPVSSARNSSNLSDETFSEDKPRVLVYGDSMTRDFGPLLQQLMPEYSVQCLTFPGAPLEFVVRDLPAQAKDFSKKDFVFVLAANNDIPNFTPQRLDNSLQQLSYLCQKTNLVISSIPYKFHDTNNNGNIFATNQLILSRISTFKYFYFECNFFLSRKMYTNHGLHLNMGGKKYFTNMLHKCLLSFNFTNSRFLLPNLTLNKENDHANFRISPKIIDISSPSLDDISVTSDVPQDLFFRC